jgi:CBS domain-containing protein
MRITEIPRRPPVTVGPADTIGAAAALMESSGVGALAVMDGRALVGIVTDRDLVRRGLARHLPPDARVDDVMTTDVVTIDASADVHDAFALFRTHAVRRLPVIDGDALYGMVSIDDMLIDLVGDLTDLVRPVTAEVLFGHHNSEAPVPR